MPWLRAVLLCVSVAIVPCCRFVPSCHFRAVVSCGAFLASEPLVAGPKPKPEGVRNALSSAAFLVHAVTGFAQGTAFNSVILLPLWLFKDEFELYRSCCHVVRMPSCISAVLLCRAVLLCVCAVVHISAVPSCCLALVVSCVCCCAVLTRVSLVPLCGAVMSFRLFRAVLRRRRFVLSCRLVCVLLCISAVPSCGAVVSFVLLRCAVPSCRFVLSRCVVPCCRVVLCCAVVIPAVLGAAAHCCSDMGGCQKRPFLWPFLLKNFTRLLTFAFPSHESQVTRILDFCSFPVTQFFGISSYKFGPVFVPPRAPTTQRPLLVFD